MGITSASMDARHTQVVAELHTQAVTARCTDGQPATQTAGRAVECM